MTQPHARAQMLISQGRFEMAERELRQLLTQWPDDATAHAMLSVCLVQDASRLSEATDEAQRAVVLAPDEPYSHYILSLVLLRRNHLPESKTAIEEAIRLDPYDADYFAHASQVSLVSRDWQAGLQNAEDGLQIDPEHAQCSNLKTISLERLGRGDEALVSSADTLKSNPDNSYSHSAHGWALLNSGRYVEAQDAFREALRLDPENQAASDGMIDAICSRSLFFRAMRRFQVSLSRLSRKYQFALIFGAWILIQILSRLGAAVPGLAPLVPVILMAYMAFAVLTWTCDSIFTTLLRFHPFGKHLLSPAALWRSNLVAACLISGTIGASFTFIVSGWLFALFVLFYWLMMCVPATAAFGMPTAQRGLIVGAAGLVIGLLPFYGVWESIQQSSVEPAIKALQTFNWSIIGLQVVANFMMVAPNRR